MIYDFFISYATKEQKIADDLVKRLRKNEYSCFIATENVDPGKDYGEVIIDGVDSSNVVLLLYSKNSEKSIYVKNEINEATSENKKIIPIRVENIELSKHFRFYLATTQWVDSFGGITDECIDKIIQLHKGYGEEDSNLIKVKDNKNIIDIERQKEKRYGLTTKVCTYEECFNLGYTISEIIMKQIEIDFLCIPKERFNISEEVEGTFEDWLDVISIIRDISCILLSDKEIVGYGSIYPVSDGAYEKLISGEKIIDPSMIDTYAFGGEFNMYIGMFGIIPKYDYQMSYVPLFDWLIDKFVDWKKRNIHIKNIGVSVYSDTFEKILLLFGFKFKGLNEVKGKIYETSIDDFNNNDLIKKNTEIKISNYEIYI